MSGDVVQNGIADGSTAVGNIDGPPGIEDRRKPD